MKKAIFTLTVLFATSFFSYSANKPSNFLAIDCWEFAILVEGEAGDSGDFDTFSHAFDWCWERYSGSIK